MGTIAAETSTKAASAISQVILDSDGLIEGEVGLARGV